MKDYIKILSEALPINELTIILRGISSNPTISDNTIRMYASALCLAWMDLDDLKDIMNSIESGE